MLCRLHLIPPFAPLLGKLPYFTVTTEHKQNVGGGLLDTGLSDGALKWMIDEASAKGLRFDAKMVEQVSQ